MKIMQLCVGVVATNCYIVYDENTRDAVVIDPGDNARSILMAVGQVRGDMPARAAAPDHHDMDGAGYRKTHHAASLRPVC